MNDTPPRGFTVRRIVVAMDSSPHSRAALNAAAELAARLHAEIEGLYVEDIDLINLAGLPFGNAVDLATGRAAPFDIGALEAQLRAETARARRALEDAARRTRLVSSFRVVRGRLETEIVAAAGEADLLILGAAGLGLGPARGFKPGRMALAAAARAPRSVLLLRQGSRILGRPLVAYDGTPAADKALDAAVELARPGNYPVRLLIAEQDTEKARALEEKAAARVREAGGRFMRQQGDSAALPDMCGIVQQTDADILVIAAEDARLQGEGRSTLLERVACPVLLVR